MTFSYVILTFCDQHIYNCRREKTTTFLSSCAFILPYTVCWGGDEVVGVARLELQAVWHWRKGTKWDGEDSENNNKCDTKFMCDLVGWYLWIWFNFGHLVLFLYIVYLDFKGSVQYATILGLGFNILHVSYSSFLTLYITCLSIS